MLSGNNTLISQNNNNFLTMPETLFATHCWLKPKHKLDEIKLLLEKGFEQGISIDAQDPEFMNSTLLHYFILWKQSEIAEFLLNKGANANIKDTAGDTPLHLLADSCFFSKLSINTTELLVKSTDELKNLKGLTPLQLATQKGNVELVKLLINYGANTKVVAQVCNNDSWKKLEDLTKDNIVLDSLLCLAKTSKDNDSWKELEDLAKNKSESEALLYFAKMSKDSDSRKELELTDLVPDDKPELKALLKLTKACKDNDFSIIDNFVTTENIQEFIDWQTSITPENSKFFDKHLNELSNLKNFLETRLELVSGETIQKINEHITFYSTVEILSPDVIEDASNITLTLSGEAEVIPEIA